MRISVLKDDPGYDEEAYNWLVSLDGVPVKTAVIADEEEGYLKCYKIGERGRVLFDENDQPLYVELYGLVSIGYYREGER